MVVSSPRDFAETVCDIVLGKAFQERAAAAAKASRMTDHDLLLRFESQSIPRPEWTHRAHVKIAFLYIRAHAFEDALQKIRTGIQKLNAANKVPEGPDMGYNETTTVAFTHLVAAVMAAYGGFFPTATADEFCDRHPQLMSPQVLRFFYSPARRMDPLAKTQFVPPDLAPLPRVQLHP